MIRPASIRILGMAAALLVGVGVARPALGAETTPEGIEFFEKKVRPVLVEHCYPCHSSKLKKPKGKFLLDSRESLLKGGESGLTVLPGHPEKSRLIEAIGYKNVHLQMPKKYKLPEAAIQDLTAWVKMGVPWPKEGPPKKITSDNSGFDLARRKRDHWAWQPIRQEKPPAVQN